MAAERKGAREYFTPFDNPKSSESYYHESWRNFISRRMTEPGAGSARPYLTNLAGNIGGTGTIYLRDDERDLVTQWLARDLETGSIDFWNQWCYDPCRIVVDIDVKGPHVLSLSELDFLAYTFQQTLKAYYPQSWATEPCLIFGAVSGPRMKKGHINSALHLIAHWSDTVRHAKQVVHGFEQRVAAEAQQQFSDVSILDIDTGIYKISDQKAEFVNMRYIYQFKKENCPICCQRPGADDANFRECPFCVRTGKVRSLFPYVPFLVLKPDGQMAQPDEFKTFHGDWLSIARQYSLWPQANELRKDFAVPSGDSVITLDSKSDVIRCTNNNSTGNNTNSTGSNTNSTGNHNNNSSSERLQVTEETYLDLESCIQSWCGTDASALQPIWPQISVSYLRRVNPTMVNVEVVGKRNRWCYYKQGEHHSNHICFVLHKHKREQLFVSCHARNSNHTTPEQNPCCWDFKGKTRSPVSIPLPRYVHEAVFPPTATKPSFASSSSSNSSGSTAVTYSPELGAMPTPSSPPSILDLSHRSQPRSTTSPSQSQSQSPQQQQQPLPPKKGRTKYPLPPEMRRATHGHFSSFLGLRSYTQTHHPQQNK